MNRLYHPLFLETILTWTPLVKDVAKIISIYSIELADNTTGDGGYEICDEDEWKSIGSIDIPIPATKTVMIDCVWFKDGAYPFRIEAVFGKIKNTHIFVFRYLKTRGVDYGDDWAVWMASYDLDALLFQMNLTGYLQNVIEYHHEMQLKELLQT